MTTESLPINKSRCQWTLEMHILLYANFLLVQTTFDTMAITSCENRFMNQLIELWNRFMNPHRRGCLFACSIVCLLHNGIGEFVYRMNFSFALPVSLSVTLTGFFCTNKSSTWCIYIYFILHTRKHFTIT